MLLVQNITLSWGKEERGAEYAGMRSGFQMAYLNLLHSIDKTIQSDSFTSHGPDYIYKQLAQLR